MQEAGGAGLWAKVLRSPPFLISSDGPGSLGLPVCTSKSWMDGPEVPSRLTSGWAALSSHLVVTKVGTGAG